jgi:hypothetical protein
VSVLIAASKANFKPAESANSANPAMNTIGHYAADDAHVIYGTAYHEGLGDQLPVTVIATGLSSSRKAQVTPPSPSLSVVQHAQVQLRTGTDNLPVLNQVAQPGPALAQGCKVRMACKPGRAPTCMPLKRTVMKACTRPAHGAPTASRRRPAA